MNALRLKRAARLLADSHLSIKEIAPATGFQDANYFARVFRAAYGCSPSEYRRSIGQR
jgi:transcriptional regulator GlxA family with amidase domain